MLKYKKMKQKNEQTRAGISTVDSDELLKAHAGYYHFSCFYLYSILE